MTSQSSSTSSSSSSSSSGSRSATSSVRCLLRSTARCCCVTLPLLGWDGVRLLLYTLVLAPAFCRFAWYYWVVADRTSIRYRTESVRQTLDVYRPAAARGAPNIAVVDENDDDYENENETNLMNDVSNETDAGTSTRGAARRRRRWRRGAVTTTTAPPPPFLLLQEPVVFFCTGGAWTIGYKMWGALLARVLTAAGVTVVVPDYRNYPWGTIPAQVADVEAALQWTLDHTVAAAAAAPTDNQNCKGSNIALQEPRRKRNVVVVGQSAGGHLLTTLILRRAVMQQQQQPAASATTNTRADGDGTDDVPAAPHSAPFVATDVSGIIALSSPYNLTAMQDTFRKHGFDEQLVDRMFGHVKEDYDPFTILRRAAVDTAVGDLVSVADAVDVPPPQQQRQLCDLLPPIKIYHGSRDRTVPPDGSIEFTQQLQAHGIAATFHMYQGWSHTDPILEGPMDADHRFHRDIFDSVVQWTDAPIDPLQWPDQENGNRPPPVMRRLCPHALVQLGRFFMPF